MRVCVCGGGGSFALTKSTFQTLTKPPPVDIATTACSYRRADEAFLPQVAFADEKLTKGLQRELQKREVVVSSQR